MKVAVFTILLLVASLTQASWADAVIEVRAHTDVNENRMVTLGDLSDFRGIDPQAGKALAALTLAEAPKAGERLEFSGAALSSMLHGQEAFRLVASHKVSLKIPNRVVIENIGDRITPFQVTDRLMSHWQGICGECRIVIEGLTMPKLAKWEIGTKWSLNLRNDLPRGSFTVGLQLTRPSGEAATYWVSGRVTYFKEVPVARRTLNIGERMQAEDFSLIERDVTFAGDGIPKRDEIIGRKLKRGIAANDVIYAGVLERDRALNRGDIVRISIGEPEWEISMAGQAEQDGYVGDTVKVRNLKSNQMISAVVVGKGEVKIE